MRSKIFKRFFILASLSLLPISAQADSAKARLDYTDLEGVINRQSDALEAICPDAAWKAHAMVVAETLPLIGSLVSSMESDTQLALREKISGKSAAEIADQDLLGSALSSARDLIEGKIPEASSQYSGALAYQQKSQRSQAACAKAQKQLASLELINTHMMNHLELNPNVDEEFDWTLVRFSIPKSSTQTLDKEVQAIIELNPYAPPTSRSGR